MQKNLIIILVLSIFISLFAILNAGAVPINLFFTSLEISVALVILISATIGAVIVFSLDTASKYQYRKKIKEGEKQLDKMEKEKEEIEEKNRWYVTELARLREQNLEQILEKNSGNNHSYKESLEEKDETSLGKSQGLKDRWNQMKNQNKDSENFRDNTDKENEENK